MLLCVIHIVTTVVWRVANTTANDPPGYDAVWAFYQTPRCGLRMKSSVRNCHALCSQNKSVHCVESAVSLFLRNVGALCHDLKQGWPTSTLRRAA